jgi:predicted nuclease of predicted toxin-antitoxin system
MRFLTDMGVAQRIVRWLRNEGHDAVHLREERLHRLPNGAIFEKAYAESRVILTFDLDFGEIIALSGGKPVSVILFRLHNTRAAHVMERLKKVLKDSGDDLEKGAIVVVEESRHRTRRLPIGTKGAE